MNLSEITKFVEESKFCYAKSGGQDFVHKSKCNCTKENPCRAILDMERFHLAFADSNRKDPNGRNEIIKTIKSDFTDSQWWKDNVRE